MDDQGGVPGNERSFRQPAHRRIGGDLNARSWRHARWRYRSGCLSVRSRNLKGLRFTNNKEFELNRISHGQPGFGRWIGPFRSVRIGKKRKSSHIISSGLMVYCARCCAAMRARGLPGTKDNGHGAWGNPGELGGHTVGSTGDDRVLRVLRSLIK